MKTTKQILGSDCKEGSEHHLWSGHHNYMQIKITNKDTGEVVLCEPTEANLKAIEMLSREVYVVAIMS